MGFWGIEVKPGKKVSPYGADNGEGKLRVTQATLGLGSSAEKGVLQCFREHKPPIFLCTLLPNKVESCSLDLEFDDDDSVTFSVIGPRSIHLSGYLLADDEGDAGDDYELDTYGEDISDTGTDELSEEYDSEDDYAGTSDYEMFECSRSPVPKSGVVIEEIVEDEKCANGDASAKKQKKHKSSASKDTQSQGQIVVRSSNCVPPAESEDEDGFPLSISCGGDVAIQKPKTTPEQKDKEALSELEGKDSEDPANNRKSDVGNFEQDNQTDRKKRRKRRKKNKEGKDEAVVNDNNVAPSTDKECKSDEAMNDGPSPGKLGKSGEVMNDAEDHALPVGNQQDDGSLSNSVPSKNQPEKQKKKRRKKNKSQEPSGVASAAQATTGVNEKSKTKVVRRDDEPVADAKPSQIRTFPNGLVIEEIAMGKPDGKRAAPGKQVSVRYIGKLKNGEIFDSNVGRAPFKFRLGIGQVIKGWDVGVNGMRIGDKRRLTIPPSLAYGSQTVGGRIPANSWLTFDVELVDVR